jgi:hypothetical protein
VAFLTRSFTYLLVLACLISLFEFAWAESSLRGARVVWVRGDRVYVASPDSVALEPGMILTFTDRGKRVATAEVSAVQNEELISAMLTSGSLAKVRHLDRLQITADRPDLSAPPRLRVGYPAAGRKNLLFDCSYQSLDSSLRVGGDRHSQLQRIYKSEMLDRRTHRLVRDSTVSVVAPWPDTLIVRLFDEVADEEIALERGDLDVAVFWPGEASAHIREVTRWARWDGGIGARGRLTATVRRPYPKAPDLRREEQQALERLNRELFRDDLAPLWIQGSVLAAPGRFEVDVSLPGREIMERFLNRALEAGAPVDTTRVVQLYYKEIWPFEPILGCPPDEYWLVVRCPVISGPKLRPYLRAIDTEALANLFQCIPAARKP